MGRLAIIMCAIVFFVSLFCMWYQALAQPRPSMDNLVAMPKMIEHEGVSHSIFDFGGLQMLYRVTQDRAPYPQCDAIQVKGQEIMVVGHDPKWFIYFVLGEPVAFRTDHNQKWQGLIKRTFLNGG